MENLNTRADQIATMEVLGLEIVGLTYEECVEQLIQSYITLSMEVKKDSYDSFRKELDRVLKPSN